MNQTNQNLAPLEERLFSVVLNFVEERSLARDLFESDLPRFAEFVRTHGGVISNEQQDYELRIIPAGGYTVIGLNRNRAPVALAGLAIKSFGAEILWDELCQQHVRMMRALGKPVGEGPQRSVPATIPWMCISLAPSYVDSASVHALDHALSLLWTVGFACLEPSAKSLTAPEKPDFEIVHQRRTPNG